MERRPALIVSTAAAVAFATAGFGYATTNLLTKPADDQVGRLTVAAQAAPPAPRPVQYIYDEVPVEVPAASDSPLASAVYEDSVTPAAQPTAPSSTTTTSMAAPDTSVQNDVTSHPEDTSYTDESHPNDHDADD